MTYGYYSVEAGASIHEHSHSNEEVWHVIEGELEVSIGGQTQIAGPGFVAIVPPDTLHSVRALTDGRAIVVDYPLRQSIGGSALGDLRMRKVGQHPVRGGMFVDDDGTCGIALREGGMCWILKLTANASRSLHTSIDHIQ
jgi:uncharacterized cupin superfamily protein